MNMKKKFADLQLAPIQVLSKEAQKQVKGGGPNSPCCPDSPYYNVNACAAYVRAGGSSGC
jgi:hypothetical protein